jgi:hypothetical protein
MDCFSDKSPSPRYPSLYHEQTLCPHLMSYTHPMTSSSSNFQLIINNALKAYEKRTKWDLLSHPLVAQIQTCHSPSSILAVLQEQVQGPNQSRRGDDRLTKWLDPTVNVIHAFSTTLVNLVCLRTYPNLRSPLSYLFGRYSHLRMWSLPGSASSSQCVSFITSHEPL